MDGSSIKNYLSKEFTREFPPRIHKHDIDILSMNDVFIRIMNEKIHTQLIIKRIILDCSMTSFKSYCHYLERNKSIKFYTNMLKEDIFEGYLYQTKELLSELRKLPDTKFVSTHMGDKVVKNENYRSRINIIQAYLKILGKFINHQQVLNY